MYFQKPGGNLENWEEISQKPVATLNNVFDQFISYYGHMTNKITQLIYLTKFQFI